MAITAGLLFAGAALPAQQSRSSVELRALVGGYFPTASQHGGFDEGAAFGLQAAMELGPNLHVLGSIGWAPLQHKYATADDRVDLYMYDVGVELSVLHALAEHWALRPFGGVGFGARTYAYALPMLTDRTSAAGYAAAGAELRLRRTALHVEARGNMHRFEPPTGMAAPETRYDLLIAVGLAYHLR